MTPHTLPKLLMALLMAGCAVPVLAADQDRTRDQTRVQDQIRDQDIYGHQLMTPEERNAHRTKMRTAKTYEEREQIRKEHHTQMQIRAKEQGLTLPDEPPAGRGPGLGPGGGGGPGPGGGGGGGPGGGRR